VACPNCSRLERAIFQLLAPGDTLQTLQPAIAGSGIPLTPEVAAYLDRIAQPSQERIAMKAIKAKRKASAYSKRYGKAFKKVAKDYLKQKGGWKKDGFKSAQKAAHKLAKSSKKL
jgi:hypothetical protein